MTTSDVENLARAVARAGSSALMISEDNQGSGWVPLGEAVTSGQAFGVEVKPALIALDLDTDDLIEQGQQAARMAEDSGCSVLWVGSGRNRHLYIHAGDYRSVVEEHFRSLLPAGAFRQVIRPPLSPHRLGNPVWLEQPESVSEALEALGPVDTPRALSEWVYRLMRDGGEDNRSAMSLKIASGFKAAGLSFRDYERAASNPDNHGFAKFHENQSEGRDPDFLRRTWDKATEHGLTRTQTVDRIRVIRDAMRASEWSGRRGRTDHRVLVALLDYAEQIPTLAPTPGERKLTEIAQLGSKQTARKSLHRLEQSGWLRCEDSATGKAYRLVTKVAHSITVPPVELWADSVTTPHPAFRDGSGLGRVPELVWSYLRAEGPSDPRTVSDAIRCSRRSVYRAVKRLDAWDLVERRERGVYAATGDETLLDRIADHLGVFELMDRQRNKHDTERKLWADEKARWRCPECGRFKHRDAVDCGEHEALSREEGSQTDDEDRLQEDRRRQDEEWLMREHGIPF